MPGHQLLLDGKDFRLALAFLQGLDGGQGVIDVVGPRAGAGHGEAAVSAGGGGLRAEGGFAGVRVGDGVRRPPADDWAGVSSLTEPVPALRTAVSGWGATLTVAVPVVVPP